MRLAVCLLLFQINMLIQAAVYQKAVVYQVILDFSASQLASSRRFALSSLVCSKWTGTIEGRIFTQVAVIFSERAMDMNTPMLGQIAFYLIGQ
jgi:hypothetical protein